MSDYVVVYHFFNYFSTIAFNIFESYNIFVMNKLKIILSVAVCKREFDTCNLTSHSEYIGV